MNNKDFDPSKISLVQIDEVFPNGYNPKKKGTKEYKNVVKSILQNGLKQPILVREVDGKYVIVDGEQRWTAAKEIGYDEVYIYNLGDISEEEAKALTIWFEVQVPFDDVELAPIAVSLNKLGMELPYSTKDMDYFKELSKVDFSDFGEEEPIDVPELKFSTLTVQMTKKQFDEVRNKIDELCALEDISEGRALELLIVDGMSGISI